MFVLAGAVTAVFCFILKFFQYRKHCAEYNFGKNEFSCRISHFSQERIRFSCLRGKRYCFYFALNVGFIYKFGIYFGYGVLCGIFGK